MAALITDIQLERLPEVMRDIVLIDREIRDMTRGPVVKFTTTLRRKLDLRRDYVRVADKKWQPGRRGQGGTA